MKKTTIVLDNGEEVWTRMTYSDVINALATSTGFVEFTNTDGMKEAISPAHVVEVFQYRALAHA